MRQYRWSHEKTCKNKINIQKNNEKLKEENEQLRKEKENEQLIKEKENEQLRKEKEKLKRENIKINNNNNNNNNTKIEHLINNQPINNQLINIIVDKTKTIEELTTKINNNSNQEINNNSNQEIIIDNKILEKSVYELHKLTLNNIVIISRVEDNYINAIQLCQTCNKNFYDWYKLDTTEEL
jgi:hypothetical protein